MKLEKWAHASEVFGSIAIVISLVILILEVRSNTLVQQQQMQLDRGLNFTDKYLGSPDLADVYAKVKAIDGIEPLAGAYVERYSLTPAEAVLWSRSVQRTRPRGFREETELRNLRGKPRLLKELAREPEQLS